MADCSIQKRGKKYALYYRDPVTGRQTSRVVGKTRHEAEIAKAEYVSAVAKGVYRPIDRITFQQFAELWWTRHAQARGMKESTLRDYRSMLDRHLVPRLGRLVVSDFSTVFLQGLQADLLSGGLSPKRVHKIMTLLHGMLRKGVQWGYIGSNPATEVERPSLARREMPVLTLQDLHRLIQHIDPYYRLLVRFAALTGLRQGEVFGLQWRSLDFDTGEVVVARSLSYGRLVEPKTASSRRRVSLPPSLAGDLAAYRQECPESELALVFPQPSGAPIDPSNFRSKVWNPAVQLAGLGSFRFHDLRHTFVSLMIDLGATPKEIQIAAGHASITTTIDRYGHLMPGAGKARAMQLDEAFQTASS